MQTHNLQQGTEEWIQLRFDHFCASEAAAMLGASSKLKRNELLAMKALGHEKEFSDYVRKYILDKGHENEALARPLAEEIIGEELYPGTFTAIIEGFSLLASVDGATMMGDVNWEHKTLNQDLAESLDAGVIPYEHKPQMEQGLMVSGAKRCLFMASEGGNKDTMRYAWYESDPVVRKDILAGWKQFQEDLINYEHIEDAPKPPAETISTLPMLSVQVEGRVVASNLEVFKKSAFDFIKNINTDLQTDQDFSNAENTVKYCKEAEEKLDLVKEQALAQTSSIDALFNAINDIKEEMRQKRLYLERLVKNKKESIRAEIIEKAKSAIGVHIANLNIRIGGNWMPAQDTSVFAAAIKGKKTVSSCRDAVDTALANLKIECNEIADRIEINHRQMSEHEFLFPDFKQVCTKQEDDFAALLALRIQEHEKRIEEERRREEQRKQQEAAQQQSREEATPAPAETQGQTQIPAGAQQTPTATRQQTAPPPPGYSVEEIIDAFINEKVASRSRKAARKYIEDFVEFSREYRQQRKEAA